MSSNWQLVKLGSVIDLLSGFAFKSSEYKESGHFLMRIANVQDGFISLEKPKFVSLNSKTSRFELFAGDILTSLTGNVGRVALLTEDHLPAALNQRVAKIKVKDPAELDSSFLLWFLKSEMFSGHLINASHGTAQANVSPREINEVPFFLPPLDEQKRIVSILDQAFEGLDRARANAEANLQSAREMFDSSVEQLINPPDGTFEERRFGDLLDFLNGHAFKSGDSVRASNVQVLRMGNLYRNQLDIDRGAVFYPENFKTQYEKYALKAGDVVLTLTGTSGKKDYGFAVEVPVVQRTLLLNQRIAKLIVVDHDRIDLSFMVFQLRSKSFLDRLYSSANGTRQANLSTAAIKEFMIKVPPMQKQKEIASKLLDLSQNIDEMKTGLETKLNDLMQLRESLLQKAFSGELT